MLDTNRPEVAFAIDAVRQAALLVRQVQTELVSPALTKNDRSPVTVADFTSQAVIGHLLEKTFPQDRMVAEEDSTTLRSQEEALVQVTGFAARYTGACTDAAVCGWIDYGRTDHAERFWTLDPIDGTKGFLRGDQYAVALALVENGEIQVAALGCPNLTGGLTPDHHGQGSLLVAARGQGAWVTPLAVRQDYTALKVSAQRDPRQARILRSFEAGHTDADKIDTFAHILGVQASPVRMDSQAKYAVLAAGGGEVILRLLSPSRPDYKEKIWDQAAGSLVLEEAGGRISDLDGNSLDFTQGRSLVENRGVLATNGWLHDAALQALRTAGA